MTRLYSALGFLEWEKECVLDRVCVLLREIKK